MIIYCHNLFINKCHLFNIWFSFLCFLKNLKKLFYKGVDMQDMEYGIDNNFISSINSNPRDKQALRTSFFSLTASLTAGVDQLVVRLPPVTAKTLRTRVFIRRPHFTLTTRLGLSGLSGSLSPQWIQLTTRW